MQMSQEDVFVVSSKSDWTGFEEHVIKFLHAGCYTRVGSESSFSAVVGLLHR